MGKVKSKKNPSNNKSSNLCINYSCPTQKSSTITKLCKNLSAKELFERATKATDEFQPMKALQFYGTALNLLNAQISSSPCDQAIIDLLVQVLQSSAYILLETGDVVEAKKRLCRAVSLAPDNGHEKIMCLAQLSEKQEAVSLYKHGLELINSEIQAVVEDTSASPRGDFESTPNSSNVSPSTINELRRASSNAYCAIAEIFMTDLCDEPNAETEALEASQAATNIDPENPQAWLTTANFRTVKAETELAKDALEHCLSLYWSRVEAVISDVQTKADSNESEEEDNLIEQSGNDLSKNRLDLEEISGIPFEAHLTMARMMMELKMTQRAANILEALLEEDNECAEVYYLLCVVGKELWLESDPDLLRYYAESAKTLLSRDGDNELALEMGELLESLPKENVSADNLENELEFSSEEDV